MTDAKVEFGTFEPEVKENPYKDVVAQLAEAGENAAVTLTVPFDKVVRERNLIAKAANAIDKTARLRKTDESGVKFGKGEDADKAIGGTVALTFTLSARHKARRGKGDTAAPEAAE